jgi:hypothetical protein
MRDSYQAFFEHFKIDFSDIIKFGIEIDTIYPDKNEIKSHWDNLIKSIENNEVVYIRGYGRDAHGTGLYKELYRILLKNDNIKKDSTNIAKPTQLLQNITNYSKTVNKDNGTKQKISNYQVTHIFGRTKNPFLFTAPWNIVWKSKMLDPFTGHESKGVNTTIYKNAFLKKTKGLYHEYINEYNILVSKYFTKEKIENAFNQMNLNLTVDEKTFEKFKTDARSELMEIK